MTGDESSDSISEIYLELALGGRAPDPDAFLAEHPGASVDERRRVLTLATTFRPDSLESSAQAGGTASDDPSADAALHDVLRSAGSASDDVEGILARHESLGAADRQLLESLTRREDAVAPEDRPRAMPERIGKYELLRQLGEGGMGLVWLARDVEIDRQVVLKTIQPGRLLAGSKALDRLRREARLAAKLDDPAICGVIDLIHAGDQTCIVMPFIAGETLAERIGRARRAARAGGSDAAPTPERDAARLVAKIARAVHAAHEAGIVHRDLKPSNLMIQPDGDPVVLDFGLAFEPEGDDAQRLTRQGDFVMTLHYAAPEQLDARIGKVDRRTDVHALGVILCELLTGRQPFDAATRHETCRRILQSDFAAPRAVNAALSRTIDAVCLMAMAPAPAARYATALAFAQDLERFVGGLPTCARPLSAFGRVASLARRERRRVGSAAVFLVLATVAIGAIRSRLAESQRKELALCAGRLLVTLTAGTPPADADVRTIRGLLPDEPSRAELDRVLARVASPQRLFDDIEASLQRSGPDGPRLVRPVGAIVELQPLFEWSVGDRSPQELHFEIILLAPDGRRRTIPASPAALDHGMIRVPLPAPALAVGDEYLWKVRLDPEHHRADAVDAFNPPAATFRVVDGAEREAAQAFRATGNAAADSLLAASSLLAHGLAEDAVRRLETIESDRRGAPWHALAAMAALELGDPEEARRRAEAGFQSGH